MYIYAIFIFLEDTNINSIFRQIKLKKNIFQLENIETHNQWKYVQSIVKDVKVSLQKYFEYIFKDLRNVYLKLSINHAIYFTSCLSP